MSAFSILAMPVVPPLVSIFLFGSVFEFLLKMVHRKRDYATWRAVVFSIANAFVILAVNACLPQLPTWGMICLLPALIMLELYCIAIEPPIALLGYYWSLLLVLLCVHSITISAFMLLRLDTMSIPWQGRFSITMLITALITVLSSHSRLFTTDELSEVIHSKNRGMLPLYYSIASCIVVLITDTPIYRLANDGVAASEAACQWHRVLFPNLLLKNLLILASYFLIHLFSIYQQRTYERQVDTTIALQREQRFRQNLNKRNVFSYCANISTDRLEEFSVPMFFSKHQNSSYRALLHEFFDLCVHPDDRSYTQHLANTQYYANILVTEPSYTLQLRVKPDQMSNLFSLDWPSTSDEYVWVDFTVTTTLEPESNDIRVYVSISDVNARMIREATLNRAAKTDSMTGLLNRAALEQSISDSLKANPQGAMFIIDMDHFKVINDTLGHRAGDALIQETATAICSVFRESDIIGRMGGDEFCVFVRNVDDTDLISRRAAMLNELTLTSPHPHQEEPLRTTLSIGIAMSPKDGTNYEELYECADRALYRAKRGGRNTFRFY